MARIATGKKADLATNYGIEIKEVDFKEFDRRKTPRHNSYESFVKYVDTVQVESILAKFKR